MLLAPENAAEIASLIVGPVDVVPLGKAGTVDRPEIIMGTVVIRLETGDSADRIVSIVRGLEASP